MNHLNVSQASVKGWYNKAKELMGGKKSISYDEAMNIFKEANLKVNEARLQQVMAIDFNTSEISTKELGAMLLMMDAQVNESGQGREITWDNYIEDQSEEGGDLENTLQNKATYNDFVDIMNAFTRYEENNNQNNGSGSIFNSLGMPQGTRYAVFDVEEARMTYPE